MKAVILAGGRGTRLLPYTLVLPKPIMPVGDAPVLEILLKWLRRSGVSEIHLSIGYLGRLVESLCGDGSQWDMKIQYNVEPQPMGTIGPLRLLKDELTETFLTMNGDLITDLDLRSFVGFHKSNGGLITVGVVNKPVKIDMGVIESVNGEVKTFQEKPSVNFKVSMGMYCMEPEILKYVPKGVPFGFDDLMHTLLQEGEPVRIYMHEGYWMDIGREEDFKKAQKEFESIRHKILGD